MKIILTITGIVLMVLIAVYIAIGSGMASWREYFELTELSFFNVWPFKLLMALFVAAMVAVTVGWIPFTPPRYGVWCVHAGIVVLVAGMATYYSNKLEGVTRIGVGETATSYLDSQERALYVKINDQPVSAHALPSLPRYRDHLALSGDDLSNIIPEQTEVEPTGKTVSRPLAKVHNWPADLKLDVEQLWSAAQVSTDYVETPDGPFSGLRFASHHGDDQWIVSASSNRDSTIVGDSEIGHRAGDAQLITLMSEAAGKIFKLKSSLNGAEQTLFVQPGESYDLGNGYRAKIESYNPQWRTITGESTRAMILMIKTPATEFRRMILEDKDLQTDFLLGGTDAGPMGKRQKDPLDKTLVLTFGINDPYHLLPRSGSERHTIITAEQGKAVDIVASPNRAVKIQLISGNDFSISLAPAAEGGPMAMMMGAPTTAPAPQPLNVHRSDSLALKQSLSPVPPAQLSKELRDMGAFNVARVRISMGQWSTTTLVPFAQEAGMNSEPWDAETVAIPQTNSTLQLQLGAARLPLPAKIKLVDFKAVPYPGGDVSASSRMRDFMSTLEIENPATQQRITGKARMNEPVYYDNGKWLFYQSGWDPNGQRWSVIGVGNRPAMFVMTLGCAMIFLGTLYAFYAKPLIIRRMKQKALADAQARKQTQTSKPVQA